MSLGTHPQITVTIQMNVRTVDSQQNPTDGTSALCREIIFKPVRVAIDSRAHSGIQHGIKNLRVIGDICMPIRCIAPDEVIGLFGQFSFTNRLRQRIGAREFNLQRVLTRSILSSMRPWRRIPRKINALLRKKNGSVARVSYEFHARSALSYVGLKPPREGAKILRRFPSWCGKGHAGGLLLNKRDCKCRC